MSAWTGLVRLELRRALRPRSTAIVLALLAPYAVFFGPGLDPPAEDVVGGDLAGNMWDVVMGLAASPATAHLMVALTALLGAELLLDPERAGVDALTAARTSALRRALAKGAATVLAGTVVGVAAWSTAALAGAAILGPAAELSEWGRASYDPMGTVIERARLHAPPPFPSVPTVGTAVVYLVQGTLVGLYVAGVAALAQRSGRAWACPFLALAGSVAGQFAGLSAINPLTQMVWVTHFPAPDGYLPWITGLPLGALFLLLIPVAGRASLVHVQREAR